MHVLDLAEAFLEQNGRDIDRARFAYHFGSMPLDEMLAVLKRYQNEDGGFSRLEVDIASPASNPFATELALLYCLQAQAPREHPLLQHTTAYLEETQTQDGDWRFGPAIYGHDLAPWFAGWEWPNLNPACTLSGLLRALDLGSTRLHDRVEALFQELASYADLADGEFYSVRPYAYYFLPDWAHPLRNFYVSGLVWWLLRQEVKNTLPTSGHFFEYIFTPYTDVAHQIPTEVLNARLDRLEAAQKADGGWPTPYAATWRPHATMQSLLILHAFGRL